MSATNPRYKLVVFSGDLDRLKPGASLEIIAVGARGKDEEDQVEALLDEEGETLARLDYIRRTAALLKAQNVMTLDCAQCWMHARMLWEAKPDGC